MNTMKRAFLWTVIPFLAFSFQSNTYCQYPDLPRLHRLTDRLFALTLDDDDNVVFFVTDDGVLVVDSGASPHQGKQITTEIRKLADKPIEYLVYTHWHPDHISGAQNIVDTGAIIAHMNTRRNLKSMDIDDLKRRVSGSYSTKITTLEKRLKEVTVEKRDEKQIKEELKKIQKQMEEDCTNFQLMLPDLVFQEECTIYLGGREVRLLYLGPGHSNGDILVYFPEEKAVHIGDIVFMKPRAPVLDEYGSAENILRILQYLLELDVDVIIPGHGEITDKTGYRKYMEIASIYFRDLLTEIEPLVQAGASLDEVKQRVKMEKHLNLPSAESSLKWNIETVYKELMTKAESKRKPTPEKSGWN